MTTPPLPAIPCLRVRLDYTQGDSFLAGSRFYLSYAGSAPTAANCAAIAAGIASSWLGDVATIVDEAFTLSEVDVLDIATYTGLSGQANVSDAGTRSGTSLPAQVALNVEFDIARRYRGGKPRIFFPPGVAADLQTPGTWNSTYLGDVATAMSGFWPAIEAISVGAVGALNHVNLSYYQGFTNITNSSGRTRAAPKYRATALVDNVEGYAAKSVLGSQKRRRTATSY